MQGRPLRMAISWSCRSRVSWRRSCKLSVSNRKISKIKFLSYSVSSNRYLRITISPRSSWITIAVCCIPHRCNREQSRSNSTALSPPLASMPTKLRPSFWIAHTRTRSIQKSTSSQWRINWVRKRLNFRSKFKNNILMRSPNLRIMSSISISKLNNISSELASSRTR